MKKRIAVVEDNEDNRMIIKAMLGDFYDIQEYATGFEAVEGIPANVPDLLLVDISLPDIDGVEVLKRLRQRHELRGVPAIAITAYAIVGDRQRYEAEGFDGYIAKPIYDEEVLLGIMDQWMSKSAS
ncbi:MAG: response regulator [Elusimicrobia bacterium]|nr:response regulator [Elusimicrobiota bacterium]